MDIISVFSNKDLIGGMHPNFNFSVCFSCFFPLRVNLNTYFLFSKSTKKVIFLFLVQSNASSDSAREENNEEEEKKTSELICY